MKTIEINTTSQLKPTPHHTTPHTTTMNKRIQTSNPGTPTSEPYRIGHHVKADFDILARTSPEIVVEWQGLASNWPAPGFERVVGVSLLSVGTCYLDSVYSVGRPVAISNYGADVQRATITRIAWHV